MNINEPINTKKFNLLREETVHNKPLHTCASEATDRCRSLNEYLKETAKIEQDFILAKERADYLSCRNALLRNSSKVLPQSEAMERVKAVVDHHFELTSENRYTIASDPAFLQRRRERRQLRLSQKDIPEEKTPSRTNPLEIEGLWKVEKQGSLIYVTNDPSRPSRDLQFEAKTTCQTQNDPLQNSWKLDLDTKIAKRLEKTHLEIGSYSALHLSSKNEREIFEYSIDLEKLPDFWFSSKKPKAESSLFVEPEANVVRSSQSSCSAAPMRRKIAAPLPIDSDPSDVALRTDALMLSPSTNRSPAGEPLGID